MRFMKGRGTIRPESLDNNCAREYKGAPHRSYNLFVDFQGATNNDSILGDELNQDMLKTGIPPKLACLMHERCASTMRCL